MNLQKETAAKRKNKYANTHCIKFRFKCKSIADSRKMDCGLKQNQLI